VGRAGGTGWEFLVSQARLQRTTSYTEMSTVLARRTGVREFDFGLDGERRAMGELLGQLFERSFGQARLLISVLVQYLNANDAGPGFYDLAQRGAPPPAPVPGREADLLDRTRQRCLGTRLVAVPAVRPVESARHGAF